MTDSPSDADRAERAEPETFRARELSVSLTVKDLEKSLEWYTTVLGFTLDRKHEREGNLIAVSLKAGVVRVLITRDSGAKGLDRVKGEGFSMRFTTSQNVDEIAARVKAHGWPLAAEPASAFGQRFFRIVDPDGFLLVIASEQ
jgi:catechol 2,3-dioxygenase-like lactoylglutathione lyase family enzyme